MDSMELALVPFVLANGVKALEKATPPFRLVDLIYNPKGPCDDCGMLGGPDIEVCFSLMCRLCPGCLTHR